MIHLNQIQLTSQAPIHWHLFTNRQSMCDFLKTIHKFPLVPNHDKVDKTYFFSILLLIHPIRKLAIKRGTFFISYAEYKIREFLFIYHKPISLFVHLTSQKILKMAMFKN